MVFFLFAFSYIRLQDALVPVIYESSPISGELVIHLPKKVDTANWYHSITLMSDFDAVMSRLKGVSNDN